MAEFRDEAMSTDEKEAVIRDYRRMMTADHTLAEYRKTITRHAEARAAVATRRAARRQSPPQHKPTVSTPDVTQEAMDVYVWSTLLTEVIGMSHALSAEGVKIEAPEDIEHAEFAEAAGRAVERMRSTGELEERETLWQEAFGDNENPESGLTDYWLRVHDIAERYRHFYDSFINTQSSHVRGARTGRKPQVKPAGTARVPTPEGMKDAFMALMRGEFFPVPGEESKAVYAQHQGSRIRIECDEGLGLGPELAINLLAEHGAAITQTFLAMMGAWIESGSGTNFNGPPHERYHTSRVTDLMRFMHRREKAKGGYGVVDQLQKGREVFILRNLSIPSARMKTYLGNKGRQETVTLALDRLIHVQEILVQRTLEEGQGTESLLEFRYHPSKEIYECLCGDNPQFAEVSGKLLSYHPYTQGYHIKLGFALAFYDRVNRKGGLNTGKRQISLTSLLKMAAIDTPDGNYPRFLRMIDSVMTTLSEDGVIPNATLTHPDSPSMSGRQKMEAASVTFSALLSVQIPSITCAETLH